MKLTIGVFGEPKTGKSRAAFCIGQYLKKAGVKRVAVIDDEVALTEQRLGKLPEDVEITIITAGIRREDGSAPVLGTNHGTKRYL